MSGGGVGGPAFEEAWKAGYAARVHEEPVLREGREQAIRDDERRQFNVMIEVQRSATSMPGQFAQALVTDNNRLRTEVADLLKALDEARAIRPLPMTEQQFRDANLKPEDMSDAELLAIIRAGEQPNEAKDAGEVQGVAEAMEDKGEAT